MARIVGTLPDEPRRSLLGSLAASVNSVARQKAEMEAGQGLRRLVPLLGQLPEQLTVLVGPTLGWMMKADVAVIGPGRVLVISAVHWKGKITAGMEEEWRGAGSVDLGRPDRRAAYFARRLEFSGHAGALSVEPVVVFTDGPVDFHGPEPLAALVQWDEALDMLASAFPADAPPLDAAELVKLLGGR